VNNRLFSGDHVPPVAATFRVDGLFGVGLPISFPQCDALAVRLIGAGRVVRVGEPALKLPASSVHLAASTDTPRLGNGQGHHYASQHHDQHHQTYRHGIRVEPIIVATNPHAHAWGYASRLLAIVRPRLVGGLNHLDIDVSSTSTCRDGIPLTSSRGQDPWQMQSSLRFGLDVELDLEFLRDEDASTFQSDVPGESPVSAVDLADCAKCGYWVPLWVGC